MDQISVYYRPLVAVYRSSQGVFRSSTVLNRSSAGIPDLSTYQL
ncbi:hypothetical protein OYT88_15305 [Sporolactobacillus sp. CQH2019]|nr:hypothetical protein [Sporolactobacillus sp. CQH2019]MDD9149920.1 hypothetical protein [Sporolactobacillus sp. CQH2019]